MRNTKIYFQFTFLMLLASVFLACDKKECELKSKYIYEPIVYDEDCDCIVSGKVKYLDNCITVALLDYGNGECDNVATKTICNNGKCEIAAGASIESFEFDCKDTFEEGPISETEALAIGI